MLKFVSFLLLCLMVLSCGLSTAAESVPVSGKVTHGPDKVPLAGISVVAYPLGSEHLTGVPLARSELTSADGLFQIDVPPGRYYFLARGDDYFSYYGRNPVTVSEAGVRGMNLSLVDRNPPPVDAKPRVETGIIGRVTSNGEPVSGVVVMVYTDLNSQLKGQGLGMTAPTDDSGFFEAPVPAGTYYLVARKRQSGEFVGPLQTGDYFGYYAQNPIRLKAGDVANVPIALVEVPETVERLADRLFGETSISGQVVDAQGTPVPGAQVLLYDNPQMLNRPLFVSQPSDASGHYVVSFPSGGQYWLAVRNQLGGPPSAGQLYGRYLDSRDGSLWVKNGQKLQDVQLVVETLD